MMKIKYLTMALLSVMPVANAAVTITPMLGYDFMSLAHDKQREAIKTNAQVGTLPAGSGVAQESDIVQALAAGIELTKNVDFELEYQQIQAMARKNKASITSDRAYFDSREQNYNGNFLVYHSLFGAATTKFRPYVLAGAGQTSIEIKDDALTGLPGRKVLGSTQDTLVNLGTGAKYHFNRNLALRGEGRLGYNTDNAWIEPMLLVGMQWRFGLQQATPPAPVVEAYVPPAPVVVAVEPPAPIDTDKDGVFDPQDQCPATPLNYAVDENGCPKVLMQDAEIPLRVLFDTNKFFVKPEFYPEIKKVADFMKEYPLATTTIEGHTDSRGSKAANTTLSQNRANAVKEILVQQFGVDAARLSAVGYGPDRPVVPNTTPDNLQQNRRTVALVKGESRKVITR